VAIADVHTWLQGPRPYRDGIALLKEHGAPLASLLALLDRGETGYSRDRLAEALSAVMRKAQEHAKASPQPAARPDPSMHAAATLSLVTELDDWPMHKYPVEIQELKVQTRHWLAERDTLHGELRRIPTKEERYRTALRIKELDDMLHAAYYRMDTYRKTGTDIGEVRNRPKTLPELHQELLNIRSYLSRASKGTRPASEEQIAAWKTRRSILQTALDAGQPV
jgi:hypothetical protein